MWTHYTNETNIIYNSEIKQNSITIYKTVLFYKTIDDLIYKIYLQDLKIS